MKMTSQSCNLFLSPLFEGNKITSEQICYCLILRSAPPSCSMPLVEVCVGGRRLSIRAVVSATYELWKASAGIILVLPPMLTWCLSQVSGFALCAGEALVCSPGCVLPTALRAHLTPHLVTLCDWKEGGEGAGCGVGLRNQQTLKWISLSILCSLAICNF